jgi:hypothetical protein
MDSQPLSWKLTVASLLAWIVSCALLVIDTLLGRGALLSVLAWVVARTGLAPSAVRELHWTFQFVELALWLILMCIGAGVAVGLEYYYRQGAGQGLLGRRVQRVIGIQIVVALLAWIVEALF